MNTDILKQIQFPRRKQPARFPRMGSHETKGSTELPEHGDFRASQTKLFEQFIPGAALIFLLTFAAYWPVLQGQFIWDDSLLVEKNPLVMHSLNLRSVWFQTDFP